MRRYGLVSGASDVLIEGDVASISLLIILVLRYVVIAVVYAVYD